MQWHAAVIYDRDTVESGSPLAEDFLRLDLGMLSQLVQSPDQCREALDA